MLSHLDWFLGCEDWCRCIIAIYVHFSSFFLLSGLFAHPSDVLWALFLASQKSTEKRETKKVATNVKYWCSLAIRTYHSCAYRSIPIIGIPDTSSMPMPFHLICVQVLFFLFQSNQFENVLVSEYQNTGAFWHLRSRTLKPMNNHKRMKSNQKPFQCACKIKFCWMGNHEFRQNDVISQNVNNFERIC